MDNVLNKREKCKYFPCHTFLFKELFDCTFCYCPIYPCNIANTGGKWIEDKDGNKIWDCTDCTVVHDRDVVKRIKKAFRKIVIDEVTE